MKDSKTKRSVLVILAVFVAGGALQAGSIDLGNSGWRASWDGSLDPHVQIVLSATGVDLANDAVYIQKSAQFTQPPVDGNFQDIPIQFSQISENAVSRIVIEDEIITNQTGAPWTDFHMQLINGPDSTFDPAATLASNGPPPIGWTIAPFTQAAFSSNNMVLDIWGGVVPAFPHPDSTWFPGDGLTNGELWINVNPTGQTVFTLKETPTPEPTTIGLLALGSVLLRRRIK